MDHMLVLYQGRMIGCDAVGVKIIIIGNDCWRPSVMLRINLHVDLPVFWK